MSKESLRQRLADHPINTALNASGHKFFCPRAKTSMTPCVVHDGPLCIARPNAREVAARGHGDVCVGCGVNVADALEDLAERYMTYKTELRERAEADIEALLTLVDAADELWQQPSETARYHYKVARDRFQALP